MHIAQHSVEPQLSQMVTQPSQGTPQSSQGVPPPTSGVNNFNPSVVAENGIFAHILANSFE